MSLEILKTNDLYFWFIHNNCIITGKHLPGILYSLYTHTGMQKLMLDLKLLRFHWFVIPFNCLGTCMCLLPVVANKQGSTVDILFSAHSFSFNFLLLISVLFLFSFQCMQVDAFFYFLISLQTLLVKSDLFYLSVALITYLYIFTLLLLLFLLTGTCFYLNKICLQVHIWTWLSFLSSLCRFSYEWLAWCSGTGTKTIAINHNIIMCSFVCCYIGGTGFKPVKPTTFWSNQTKLLEFQQTAYKPKTNRFLSKPNHFWKLSGSQL